MSSAQSRLDRLEQLAGDAPLLRAHAAGRLVEQQQLGLRRQRHGDFEPLLLAVAQLARQVVGPVGQAEAVEQAASPRRRARGAGGATSSSWPARLARLQRQQDVVVDRQLRQHRGDLELEAEAGAGALVGRRRA